MSLEGERPFSVVVFKKYFRALAEDSLPARVKSACLVSPLVDFLALGGGSLVFLLCLKFWGGEIPKVGSIALAFSFVINYPHFTHSYQIFYRNFSAKLLKTDLYPLHMRARFFIVGILVPLSLLAFFAWCMLEGGPNILGYTINLTGALLAWHYVKQGYGALILCAVRGRQFFSELDKKLLLANAFAACFYGWCTRNVYTEKSQFWGIEYHSFALPSQVHELSTAALLVTSLLALAVFFRKDWSLQSKLPWNGIVAYLCSLYAWTAFSNIFHGNFHMFLPIFHALQYVIMVWKYEDNKLASERKEGPFNRWNALLQKYWFLVPLAFLFCTKFSPIPQNWLEGRASSEMLFLFNAVISLAAGLFLRRIFVFIVAGLVFGIMGFWLVPLLLQEILPYDKNLFGGALFFFMVWGILNIHHYFMDSVTWRKENKDVGRYLFQEE